MHTAPAAVTQGCSDKWRLLDAYTAATAEYSRSVETLSRQRGVLEKHSYESLRLFCERARERSELARRLLEDHIGEHGC